MECPDTGPDGEVEMWWEETPWPSRSEEDRGPLLIGDFNQSGIREFSPFLSTFAYHRGRQQPHSSQPFKAPLSSFH